MGGHLNSFSKSDKDGDHILIKLTKTSEIKTYERIFNSSRESDGVYHEQNVLLKRFLPAYYGSIPIEDDKKSTISE